MKWGEFVHYFVSLFVICSPISALPALLALTQGRSAGEKRKTGVLAGLAVGVILIVVTWIGSPLLSFFGITVFSFQFAGGIVVLLLALSLLNAEVSRMNQTVEDQKEARHKDSIVVVPLAIPLLAGPGAITTVIVAVNDFPGIVNQIYMSFCAIAIALVFSTILFFSAWVERFLGTSGINIISRLAGLILAAIAVEMLARGAIGLFPVLASRG